MRSKLKRKTIAVSTLIALPIFVAAGSYFQPWKLFTDIRVEESLPQVADNSVAPKGARSDKPDSETIVKNDSTSKSEGTQDSVKAANLSHGVEI